MAESTIIKYGFKSVSFLSYIKIGLLIIFLAYILAHAIMLGIEKKDSMVVITELGKEFLSPIKKAHEISIRIINRDNSLFDYWGFYSSLYMIYLWIRLLSMIVGYSPVSNESNKFINITLAILFFCFIQMLYLAINGNDLNIIWKVWIDIFNAIKFKMVGSKLDVNSSIVENISENFNCSSGVCRI